MRSFCIANAPLGARAGESLGSAAVELLGNKGAVLSEGEPEHSLARGIEKAGGLCISSSGCFESQLFSAQKRFAPDLFFFVKKSSVCIYGADCQPISDEQQAQMAALAVKGGTAEKAGGRITQSDLNSVYYSELIRQGESFENLAVCIESPNESIRQTLSRALLALGGSTKGRAKFKISASGLVLCAVDESGELHSHSELLQLCCACELESGVAVEMPFSASLLLGGAPKGLTLSVSGGSELWQKDAVFLAATLLRHMAKQGCGLCTLCERLGKRSQARRSFSSERELPLIADSLDCDELLTDNCSVALLKGRKGDILLTRSPALGHYCVEACAASAETADELIAQVISLT